MQEGITNTIEENFWRKKTLNELNDHEWELLCDGCGKCCLEKIYYVNTKELYLTKVSCRLLDTKSCKCTNYAKRFKYVNDCIKLNKQNVSTISWLPKTCAYRLVNEGKDLFNWHPLKTKNKQSTITSGNSVSNKAIHPALIEGHIENYIIHNEDEFFNTPVKK